MTLPEEEQILTPVHCTILNVATHAPVGAVIAPLSELDAEAQIDNQWWELDASRLEEEDDRHWVWADVVAESTGDDNAECFGLSRPGELAIEGAMTLHVLGYSWAEPQLLAVNVLLLASAPRNRPWLTTPAFKGVGTALLTYAAALSYNLGYGGRVSLSSFPDRSERFYAKQGLERRGVDPETGLMRMELRAGSAEVLLRTRGLLP